MIINCHHRFLALNIYSLYLSFFPLLPSPLFILLPFPSLLTSLFSPLFDYFIYHVEGVVSYHIDRAERISSSNTIEHRNVDGSIQVSEPLIYCKIST